MPRSLYDPMLALIRGLITREPQDSKSGLLDREGLPVYLQRQSFDSSASTKPAPSLQEDCNR